MVERMWGKRKFYPLMVVGNQCGILSKNLKNKILYDLALPLLGIYSKDSLYHRGICTSIFVAILVTITRSRTD